MTRWRAVGPVAWANLRGHRIPAALIALTLAACGGLLTFGVAAQTASGNAFDHLWHTTNGADLWLYLDAGRVTAAAADQALAETAGVTSWNHPQPQMAVKPTGVAQNGFSSGFALREWPGRLTGAWPDLRHVIAVVEAGERDEVVEHLPRAHWAGPVVGVRVLVKRDPESPDGT